MPLPVTKRKPAHVEPSVDAIETTNSYCFIFNWISCGERSLKSLKVPRAIVGVNCVVYGPLTHLFQRLSEVVQKRLADPLKLAARA